MPIYTGKDGITRTIKGMHASYYRHVEECKTGIDGVVRTIFDFADMIKYLCVDVNSIQLAEIDSNGNLVKYIGETKASIEGFGSVTIDNSESVKEVIVSCTAAKKRITIHAGVYVELEDGCVFSTSWSEKVKEFELNVTGMVGSNTTGRYRNECLGQNIVDGYVDVYKEETKILTSVISNSAWTMCGLLYNGNTYSKLKFNSFSVNGKTIPIKIIDSLK